MKKKTPILIALLLITVFTAACSKDSSDPRNSSADAGDKKNPVTIEFAAGKDASGELEKSIERFNRSHDDIQIKYVEMPAVPNEQITRYSTWFNSKSDTPDLLMIDVT